MKLGELAYRLPAAGLALGGLAWAASTEVNYALAPAACSLHWPLPGLVALILVVLGLAGVAVSALAWLSDRPQHSPDAAEGGVPHKLMAQIGVLAGVLFTVVILMQGLANLFLTGCE